MKKIISLFSLFAITACTYGQQPAPYQAYGNDFYGKNGHRSENANANYVRSGRSGDSGYASNNTPPSNQDDYNRSIDQQNASTVTSRPLGTTVNANGEKPGEVYSHQLSNNSAISGHSLAPVAIDSDQQVVKLSPNKNSIHSGNSLASSNEPQRGGLIHPTIQEPESVPAVEKKEAFVNPSQLNEERKASNNLDKIHPVPKPKLNEVASDEEETIKPAPVASTKPAAAAAPAKTKITAKVKKVETVPVATAAAPASAPAKVTAKPVEQAKEADEDDSANTDEANDADEQPEPAAKPAKPGAETKKLVEKTESKEPASGEIAAKTEITEPEQEEDKPAEKPSAKSASTASNTKPSQFIKPVDGQIISEFGSDKAGGGFNDGISIQAPEGTPVKAASGGQVVYSGNQLQGYGNLIIIRHANGFLSSYSHLKELELKKGENVTQGEVVGHVGRTGNVETPQLHFGIRKGREPVDPKTYLQSSNQ